MVWLSILFIFFAPMMLGVLNKKRHRAAINRHYIKNYKLPEDVIKRFSANYPDFTSEEISALTDALKVYFECCSFYLNRSKHHFIPMPSKAVDMLWHEFILNTRAYQDFCSKAFGVFLHHTPNEMATVSQLNSEQHGFSLLWRFSCEQENINLRSPACLPLLFAIDSELNIPNGFYYDLKSAANMWGLNSINTRSSCGGGGGSCGGGGGGGCGGGGGGGGCGGGG